MRGLAIFKLIVWGIVAFVLFGVLTNTIIHGGIAPSLFSGFHFSNTDSSYEVVGDYTLPADDVREILIDWKSGKIDLLPSKDNSIRLIEKAPVNQKDDKQMKYDVSSGKLTVQQDDRIPLFFFVDFYQNSSNVEVYLPQKLYDKINAQCTSGQIDASKLQATIFTANTTSGRVQLSEIKADKSTIGTTSGSIVGSAVAFGQLDCKATSGKIDLQGSFKDIRAVCSSGNVALASAIRPDSLTGGVTSGMLTVTLPENDGFTLHFNVTSGSFRSDFALPHVRADDKSGTAVYKDGAAKFDLDVTSGRLELRRGK